MMSQSEVYVFEVDKMVQGFVGLNDEYTEGIFVSEEMQSCGIGNRAISFYQREGFIIQCEGLDEAISPSLFNLNTS